MPSDLIYLNSLDQPISKRKGVLLFFLLLPCFTEITVINANRVDPDQTPCSAASDLDLHVCQYLFYGTLGIYELDTCITTMYLTLKVPITTIVVCFVIWL